MKIENEIPQFRKVYALIPIELFLKLRDRNLLNSHFDEFIAKAIEMALEAEGDD